MVGKSLLRQMHRLVASISGSPGTKPPLATPKAMPEIFGGVYASGIWGRTESRSGFGSNLIQTAIIRAELPRLASEFGVRSFLDIPCGDWFWMQHVELGVESYIGA